MTKPSSMRAFVVFIVFAAGFLVAVLSGLVSAIVDDSSRNLGDAATWFGAVATTAVAYLAWRTARDAATTAREAYLESLAAESRSVDFEFLPQLFSERDPMKGWPIAAERFPPPEGKPDWEDIVSGGGPPVYIVVTIHNNNPRAMAEGHFQLKLEEEDGGPRILGRIRRGTSQYYFAIARTWHSDEPVRRRLLDNRTFAEYLEFTDTRGRRWRLAADGRLEPTAIHGA